MELGFAISKGPLSQISVPLIGIDTAVHLAVGAYGWWKARERNQSLEHQLGRKGVHLATAMTFNRIAYLTARASNGVRGVAVQNNAITTLALPSASTAGDEGITCLRALISALLCFYDEGGVTDAVASVLPDHLVNYDVQGETLLMEGPVRAALRQCVVAIQTEEDSDSYRRDLLDHVAQCRARLSSSMPPRDDVELISVGESHLLTGLLNWVLTSPHKRQLAWYPTRSINVWSLAVVLERVGFDVRALTQAVGTADAYRAASDAASGTQHGSHPAVGLVTVSVGPTDHEAGATRPQADIFRTKPQIYPIQAIPLILFNHMPSLPSNKHPTVSLLYEVWQFAFDRAAENVQEPSWNDGAVRLGVRADAIPVPKHLFPLLRPWAPLGANMSPLLGDVFGKYIPDDVDADAVYDFHQSMLGRDQKAVLQDGGPACILWHILTAAMVGTLFAVFERNLIVDGTPATRMTEVAFSPDILYEHKIPVWASVLGRALCPGGVPSSAWAAFLMEAATGADHPQMAAGHRKNPKVDPKYHRQGAVASTVVDILGLQANGMVVLSDIIVRPSTHAGAVLGVHVHRGQLVTLPLDDGGFVRASVSTRPAHTVQLDATTRLATLSSGPADTQLRIDVEPDWAGDPRTVVFHARHAGASVATWSPLVLLDRICTSEFRVPCGCDAQHDALAAPDGQAWHAMPLSRVVQAARRGRVDLVGTGACVVVPVAGSDAARLFCAGVFDCGVVVSAETCVACSLRGEQVQRHFRIAEERGMVLLAGVSAQPQADTTPC